MPAVYRQSNLHNESSQKSAIENIQGSGSFAEGNGNGSSNAAPTCDSSQPLSSGNRAGAALCIVNSNTSQITTQHDHVFAISLVKVSGTGTIIAAPVPKGYAGCKHPKKTQESVITSESQTVAADALAVQSDG
jgi:hypothetical protein